MKSWREMWLFSLICSLCLFRPSVNGANPGDHQGNLCACHKSCFMALDAPKLMLTSESKSDIVSLEPSFIFDSKTSSCREHSSGCAKTPGCVFRSQKECLDFCGSGDMPSSPSDTADKDTKKTKDVQESAKAPSSSSRGRKHDMRWDLIGAGVCVLILLIAVLVVSGVMTYHYREKQREKLRSKYIHNVLEMYESGSESSASEGGGKSLVHKDSTQDTQLFVKA